MAQLTRTDGTKIRARRELLRMTIAQVVAKLAEIGTPRHRDTIYNIENGKQPSIPLLAALEQVLEVEPGAFAPDPPKRRRRKSAEPVGGGRA